jgi:hypothetical protein
MFALDSESSQPAPRMAGAPQLSARGNAAPPSAGSSMWPRWKFLNQSVRSRK